MAKKLLGLFGWLLLAMAAHAQQPPFFCTLTNSWVTTGSCTIADSGLPSVMSVKTFQVPLASTATVNSITNNGTTSTMNCNIANCGLSNGASIALGEGFALATNCQGPHTISAIGGNTASFASTNCAASAGPYTSQIGQLAAAVHFINPVALPNGSSDGYVMVTNRPRVRTTERRSRLRQREPRLVGQRHSVPLQERQLPFRPTRLALRCTRCI